MVEHDKMFTVFTGALMSYVISPANIIKTSDCSFLVHMCSISLWITMSLINLILTVNIDTGY